MLVVNMGRDGDWETHLDYSDRHGESGGYELFCRSCVESGVSVINIFQVEQNFMEPTMVCCRDRRQLNRPTFHML